VTRSWGLPVLPLVGAPTPVEHFASLGCWVKRDDRTNPIYGGNKVRKLEFLLGDARARGRRAVVTIGATSSNDVLATAIHGGAAGLAVHAVVFPAAEDRSELFRSRGVGLTRVPGKSFVPLGVVGRGAASLAAGTGLPYLIGPGGSSPLGSLGYVAAALELARQVDDGLLPAPATIFVPYGSGGTAAGLAVGLALAGLPSRVVAVQVVERPWASPDKLRRLAARIARLLAGLGVSVTPGKIDVAEDQLGPGYARSTPAADLAVARGGDAGLTLETTYSGKALSGLLATSAPTPVLFWLTYSPCPVDFCPAGQNATSSVA
jgi:D-cysteine desulfhydrase